MTNNTTYDTLYDTSGILHSINLDFHGFITPRVVMEIKDEILSQIVRKKLRNGELKILNPSSEYIKKVEELNEKFSNNLSETDIEVIAVALEFNLKIITNDFAIQNISKILKVHYESVCEEEIKEIFAYEYVCVGCGIKYKKQEKFCKICGAEIAKIKVKKM